MTNTPSQLPSFFKTLTIAEIKEEVKGFKTIVFESESSDTIPYKPGQYLTLVHQDPVREVRRSYSITSSPALNEPLAIGVKRIENGFYSRQLVDKVKAGDRILTTGAAGFFTLPDNMADYRQVFLLAAGSGITPILSLLKTLLYQHPAVLVTLVYSNSSPGSAVYLKELKHLAQKFPKQLYLELLFSNSPDLSKARLHKDLLQALLRKHAHAPHKQMLFYLCGPLNYMRMCFYALRQANIPKENIRKESFNTESAPPKITPPDTTPHDVTLRFRDQEHRLQVQYPDSILKAARKENILLPYSCEAGKCGNCVARVRKGQVWMSYNEVLTDRETRQGLTLTCVGHPVGGDVTLDIL